MPNFSNQFVLVVILICPNGFSVTKPECLEPQLLREARTKRDKHYCYIKLKVIAQFDWAVSVRATKSMSSKNK